MTLSPVIAELEEVLVMEKEETNLKGLSNLKSLIERSGKPQLTTTSGTFSSPFKYPNHNSHRFVFDGNRTTRP